MDTIRVFTVAAFLAAVPFVTACEDPPPPPTQPSASPASTTPKPSAKPSATAPAPSATAAADAKGKMTHCPNAVTGAKTEIKDTKEGVEITVTSSDAAAVKEIRERAKHSVEASKADDAGKKHTGEGTGGGALGRCPVVAKNTVVEASDVEGGSKISVKPKDAKEADWLRRETKERNAELAQPGALDAGQGRMAHCPNAVEGATTAIKETKDTIEISVTAKGDAAVKDIQARAKHLVEAAKLDPTDVKHTGDGKGGGGLGRCPVVVKDTTVDSKEIAGGAMLTVKPKKAADFDALKKEVQERNAKLASGAAAAPATTGATSASAGPAVTPPKK
jgi:TusA-related sulfurtransferase